MDVWTFHCNTKEILIFQEVDMLSNAIANYFYESGFRQGDVVAIVMENRPEVVFYWLGLAKIGAVGALVNFNLRDKSLLHCIDAAKAHGIVFSEELAPGTYLMADAKEVYLFLYSIAFSTVYRLLDSLVVECWL